MFRVAKLLPPGTDDEVSFGDWENILKQFLQKDQEEMRRIVEMKLDGNRQEAAQLRAKKLRPEKNKQKG
jgi:hypothetical protein